VRVPFFPHLHPLLAVRHAAHVEAKRLQQLDEQLAARLAVFDDEDTVGGLVGREAQHPARRLFTGNVGGVGGVGATRQI
jgi:hypothetical protein